MGEWTSLKFRACGGSGIMFVLLAAFAAAAAAAEVTAGPAFPAKNSSPIFSTGPYSRPDDMKPKLQQRFDRPKRQIPAPMLHVLTGSSAAETTFCSKWTLSTSMVTLKEAGSPAPQCKSAFFYFADLGSAAKRQELQDGQGL